MLRKIKIYSEQNHMLEKGDRVVAGVSGGADSVCLFFVLLEWMEELALSLRVVHVNHGIRGGEAKEDAAFVERLCRQYGIPCEIINAEVPNLAARERISLEEAGRRARYDIFERVQKQYGYDKIAVAHNRNDQSETVLLHLFRGSGVKGLGGMAPVRGAIIRPLLDTSRQEIEGFLGERGIAYCEDKSNLEDVYTRNKVRLKLLPLAEKEINEKAGVHIAKTAVLLREAEEYIEKNAVSVFERIVRQKNGIYFIGVEDFSCEEAVIQKKILLLIMERLAGGRKDVESVHVDLVRELLQKQVGRRVSLPYGMEAVRAYEGIQILKGKPIGAFREKEAEPFMAAVEPPGVYAMEAGMGNISFQIVEIEAEQKEFYKKYNSIPKNDYTKWFDYDKIKNTVFIRYRQEGDFLQINSKGSRKKLKDYFIDKKIPREQRGNIPLLAEGSHVIWIIGERISEAYKVDKNTKRILMVQLDKGAV